MRRLLVLCAALALVAAFRPSAPALRQAPVIVVLDTVKGRIEIEVNTRQAPLTSANFLRYVDAGAYNDGVFHRTVRPDTEIRKDVPIQVIQASRSATAPELTPIALERTSVTGLRHVDGAVSMARNGPDTATSDFFICVGDQPSLDFGGRRNADGQGFAAFGRVVTGMDVVRAIQAAPVSSGSQTLTPPIRILKAARRQ
jgi:peptidyl-prolyl cis-trans isomerase A (cyclophilin A)